MHRNKIHSGGLFHKTLQIRKLRICIYGQILTVKFHKNGDITMSTWGRLAVNYNEKSFTECSNVKLLQLSSSIFVVLTCEAAR